MGNAKSRFKNKTFFGSKKKTPARPHRKKKNWISGSHIQKASHNKMYNLPKTSTYSDSAIYIRPYANTYPGHSQAYARHESRTTNGQESKTTNGRGSRMAIGRESKMTIGPEIGRESRMTIGREIQPKQRNRTMSEASTSFAAASRRSGENHIKRLRAKTSRTYSSAKSTFTGFIPLGRKSQLILCPNCQCVVKTETKKEHSYMTHCCCILMCLSCMSCCSCLPYLVRKPRLVTHVCPLCKMQIGVWQH